MQPLRSLALLALCAAAPLSALPQDSSPKLRVVTTLGVLADIARAVGGERVSVENVADPRQDPHYVQPRPTLMQKVREADVLVEVGLQLELWAQKVVDGAGNTRVQIGQPGRVVASAGITTLELPAVVSREYGDIHPYGNPHVWLDPLNAKVMAKNIAAALERVDPAGAPSYRERLAAFERRIDEALFGAALVEQVGGSLLSRAAERGRLFEYLEQKGLADSLGGWLAKAQPLRGQPLVTYHKTWAYFAARFGLEVSVEIEEKPGIPPSARHRERVLELMQKRGVRTILQEVFYDRAAADYLAERTGARVVVVPLDVGPEVGVTDYFDLIDTILAGLVGEGQRG